MNTTNEAVLFEVNNVGVATVTLNTPDKHNAFDDVIIETLKRLFIDIAKRNDIRIVILAANGKSFSAGADLAWMKRMASYGYEENVSDANNLAKMLQALNFLPQTTIAKVQGAAYGGAVGLASCCDIVIASDRASFCLSEVKLGLIPATISPYVVAAIGQKAARRYFQTAERFSANKAAFLGLVDEVTSSDELNSAINNMVSTLLANGPEAIKQAKQLALDVANQDVDDELLGITSERIAAIRVSEQGQEGLQAFFEKRQPQWQKADKNEGQ